MYVCICNQVNDRSIVDAVRAGARSVDDLAIELDVGTCCGKCCDDARRVIENTLTTDTANTAHHFGGGLQLVYDATA